MRSAFWDAFQAQELKPVEGKGTPRSEDVKPFPVRLRVEQGYPTPEQGLMAAAINSFFSKKHQPILRQSMLDAIQGNIKLSQLMSQHRLDNARVRTYDPADVAHSIIKSSWRSLKQIADGRTIILPGRDVWPWEILARKEGYPTVYDPRISRLFSGHHDLLREAVDAWGVDLRKCLMFDTGWNGSIPAAFRNALGITFDYKMLSAEENSYHNRDQGWTQLFPNHKGARGKVLCIEYFPKYHKSGTGRMTAAGKSEAVQYLADPLEFVKAAALTIWVWHHQSPRFVNLTRKAPEEEEEEEEGMPYAASVAKSFFDLIC